MFILLVVIDLICNYIAAFGHLLQRVGWWWFIGLDTPRQPTLIDQIRNDHSFDKVSQPGLSLGIVEAPPDRRWDPDRQRIASRLASG